MQTRTAVVQTVLQAREVEHKRDETKQDLIQPGCVEGFVNLFRKESILTVRSITTLAWLVAARLQVYRCVELLYLMYLYMRVCS